MKNRSLGMVALAFQLVVGIPYQTGIAQSLPRHDINGRVVNGNPVSAKNSPVVKLLIAGESCTGSMIAPNVVLTAAHCVKRTALSSSLKTVKTSKVFVKFNGKLSAVARIKVHPLAGANEESYHDLALVYLKKKLAVAPIRILLSRDVKVGDRVKIHGYGRSFDDFEGRLHEGYAHIDAVSDINLMITIKTSEATGCHGDSGGPVTMSYTDDTGIVHSGIVGITSGSSGDLCEVGETGYYARVQAPSLLSFITTNVPEVKVE